MPLGIDDAIGFHQIDRRHAFHRLASRDRVVLRLVGGRPSARALGDVSHDRLGCPPQLICVLRESARERRQQLEDEREEFDRDLVRVKLVNAQHAGVFGRHVARLLPVRTT